MKDPDQALSKFHADLLIENGGLVSQISSGVQMQYQSLQKQHNDFVTHLQAQLQQLQSHLSHLQTQLAQAQAAVITQSIASQIAVSAPPLDVISQQTSDGFQPNRPQGFNPSPFGPSMAPFNRPPMGPGPGGPGTQPMHPPPFDYHAPWAGPPPPVSSAGPPGFPLPDFSKPPPGFPPAGIPRLPPPDIDLTPAVPYYELPAGLMAPLVKLEDHDYRPLDPRDIRLPPPMPPSDRLLAAVEAFYSPPFHDRPRDSEGWEKLGLYEFFKAKQKARKMKEQDEESRSRSRSRSGSRSQSRSRSQSGSESGSRSGSQSPKREPSPPPRRRRYNSDSNNSPERQDRSKSNSPLPYRQSSNSPPPRRRSPSPPPRRRERSRSPSEERERSKSRSPTPPMFSTDQFLAAAAAAKTTEKLGEENKGHMLLRKMGWGGKGLGAKEQGIVNPIEAAEVRDRTDMYKGIGNEHDPFEQFRKNKAQGFITRMQAREIPPTEVKKKRPDT
ncbi:hypothetical protein DPMN_175036 [Dreissena polymorpha]|uniref:G-patch domain-containing protein n=2 Tax=Dreissena polymorpha TaxID=45954 RepID=A0A9D4E6G9_DREPO|nr:hypothetical protein DPMN_175036 [Dreissena polymorpha]